MNSRATILIGLGLGLAAAAAAGPGLPEPARTVELEVRVELDAIPPSQGPLHVFVPVPLEDAHQELLETSLDAPFPGVFGTEERYGNRFWHGQVERGTGEPMSFTLRFRVRRRAATTRGKDAPALGERERHLYLSSNLRVPVGTQLVEEVLADVPFDDPGPFGEARSLFDHVVATMEYKKVGTGWGNGDTFWACSQRYGNCTDFHALLTSLARTRKIPARFSIGFPVPTDVAAAELPGYHCWLDLHLPEAGWFPLDASEAWKHPEHRDQFFGVLPADRVALSVGRDLELGEGHRSGPLNYFVYPHAEVAGERFPGIRTRVSFQEVGPPHARADRQ